LRAYTASRRRGRTAVGALAIASIGLFLARRNRAPIALSLLAASQHWRLCSRNLRRGTSCRYGRSRSHQHAGYAPILRHHDVKYVILARGRSIPRRSPLVLDTTLVVPLVIVAVLIALVMTARRQRSIEPAGERRNDATRPRRRRLRPAA